MTKRILSLVALVGLAGILSGCVAGYNSLLFATKTNVGFEVDTQPPKVSLDIGRYEGLLAPSYEDGKTPPVLAAFKFDSEGPFSAYLGSAMATGNASVAMARLYNAPDWDRAADPKDVWKITRDQWENMEDRFDSGIELQSLPKLPWPLKQPGPGSVNPVLFSTDTSFGFKVAWSGIQAMVPDYVRLAYQRRELAYAAVTIGREKDSTTGETSLVARTPSLLATVDVALETQKFLESRVGYLQYFASGRAATALALRKDVRQAMTRRLDPEQAARMEKADFRTIYRGDTCTPMRLRVRLWMHDETAVTVDDLNNARDKAKTALDNAADKTDALKKADLLARRRVAVADDIVANNNDLTAGAIRETLLLWYLEDNKSEAVPAIWVNGAHCEDVEKAIDYFAMP